MHVSHVVFRIRRRTYDELRPSGVEAAIDATRERSIRTLQDRQIVVLDLRIISTEIRKAKNENEEDDVITVLKEHRNELLHTFKYLEYMK